MQRTCQQQTMLPTQLTQALCWDTESAGTSSSLALGLHNWVGSQGASRSAVFNLWVATPLANVCLPKYLRLITVAKLQS